MGVSRLTILLLSSVLPLAVGCGISADLPVADTASAAVSGHVKGGQQPVSGATISVWSVGTSGYGTGAVQLASTTSDAGGNFQFAANAYTCPFANTPVYLLASGGNPGLGGGVTNPNLVLGAALGTCAAAKSEFVIVNEVTTAALALSLGQFFSPNVGGAYTTDLFGGTCTGCAAGTYNVGLAAASNNTYPMLVSNAAGMVNPSTAAITIEAAKINTIANILAACVNSTGQTSTTDTTTNCGKLFSYTKPGTATRPLDTLQAAVEMSRIPYQNVTALYNLTSAASPFVGLSATPNDWTVAVSYTSSTFGLGLNAMTSSNLAIDATGRVWLPTNAAAAHGIAFFDPASSSFNGPYATTLLRPQYVLIDRSATNLVYATDTASGALQSVPTTSPSAAGSSYSVTNSTAGGPLAIDTDSSVFFTYSLSGNPKHSLGYVKNGIFSVNATSFFTGLPTGLLNYFPTPTAGQQYPGTHGYVASTSLASNPGCEEEYVDNQIVNAQGVISIRSNTSPCSTGGFAALGSPYGGGVVERTFTAPTLNKLGSDLGGIVFTPPVPVNAPQGIASDGKQNFWIANSGNGSISTLGYVTNNGDASDYHQLSPVAYLHNSTNGNTMTTPYGLAIDRSGNVWVSNASCVSTGTTPCVPVGLTLTEVIGAAGPMLTPLSAIPFGAINAVPTN